MDVGSVMLRMRLFSAPLKSSLKWVENHVVRDISQTDEHLRLAGDDGLFNQDFRKALAFIHGDCEFEEAPSTSKRRRGSIASAVPKPLKKQAKVSRFQTLEGDSNGEEHLLHEGYDKLLKRIGMDKKSWETSAMDSKLAPWVWSSKDDYISY
jgi:hypothetical protein